MNAAQVIAYSKKHGVSLNEAKKKIKLRGLENDIDGIETMRDVKKVLTRMLYLLGDE